MPTLGLYCNIVLGPRAVTISQQIEVSVVVSIVNGYPLNNVPVTAAIASSPEGSHLTNEYVGA